MPNVAAILKEEIGRVARKEIRSETGTMKNATTQFRRDIAALKRQVADQEKRLAVLETLVLKKTPIAEPADIEDKHVRFSPKGLPKLRKRLGLSAADLAALTEVSTQSVYNWERGKTRPRKEQLAVIAALRGMGKKEVKARLVQVVPPAEKPAAPAKPRAPRKRRAPKTAAAPRTPASDPASEPDAAAE
jgi:DNA-binding transcriptional regulator YiaG